MSGKRIVLTKNSLLRDLHPYIALALELKVRSYQVVLAINELYSSNIEAASILFHPVRPDTLSLSPKQVREIVRLDRGRVNGTKYVIRELVLPHLKDSYEALMQVVSSTDLLLTHPIIFAGSIVDEEMGIRWISSVFAPTSFLSAFDPPVLPTQSAGRNLKEFDPLINGTLFLFGKLSIRSWSEPLRQIRAENGHRTACD